MSKKDQNSLSASKQDVRNVGALIGNLGDQLRGVAEQVGQLMLDSTEIKNELKIKVNRDEFAQLEKRVTRLETKAR